MDQGNNQSPVNKYGNKKLKTSKSCSLSSKRKKVWTLGRMMNVCGLSLKLNNTTDSLGALSFAILLGGVGGWIL